MQRAERQMVPHRGSQPIATPFCALAVWKQVSHIHRSIFPSCSVKQHNVNTLSERNNSQEIRFTLKGGGGGTCFANFRFQNFPLVRQLHVVISILIKVFLVYLYLLFNYFFLQAIKITISSPPVRDDGNNLRGVNM